MTILIAKKHVKQMMGNFFIKASVKASYNMVFFCRLSLFLHPPQSTTWQRHLRHVNFAIKPFSAYTTDCYDIFPFYQLSIFEQFTVPVFQVSTLPVVSRHAAMMQQCNSCKTKYHCFAICLLPVVLLIGYPLKSFMHGRIYSTENLLY